MKKILVCFAAGALGALFCSVLMWAAGDLGLSKKLGVSIAPMLTAGWLYPRIVWGGIWGELFALPLWRSRPLLRGILFSLPPSAVQLFYFFPFESNRGIGGIDLGILTPLWVIAFNGIWGIVTSFTIRWSR